MRALKTLLIVLVLSSLVAGCATISENENTARVTVMYATIKVIDEDQAKADRIVEIAEEVKEYASNVEQLTVDLLISETRAQIDWSKLDAADRLLVDTLLVELETRLKERFDGAEVPEELALTVEKVADWVINAALMI